MMDDDDGVLVFYAFFCRGVVMKTGMMTQPFHDKVLTTKQTRHCHIYIYIFICGGGGSSSEARADYQVGDAPGRQRNSIACIASSIACSSCAAC